MWRRCLYGVGILILSASVLADEQSAIHVDVDELRNGAEVKPVDGITSAGQPNAQDFAAFADAGYVAVIDMRGPAEDRGLDEPTVVEGLGMTYISLPLASPDSINFENAAKLDAMLAEYDGPVLLHCGSGNRVGALLALRKSQQGAGDEEALSYGRSAGLTGLEPVVRARLAEKD